MSDFDKYALNYQAKSFLYFLGLFIASITLLPATTYAGGTITGNIYRDFNGSGTQDAGTGGVGSGDPGVAGIVVKAYDSANVAQGTATSLADGTYSLVAAGTGPYRIEFSSIPTYLQPGENGADSASSVQFVADGNSANINMGLNNPADYYNDPNPLIALPRMLNGNVAGNTALGIGSFSYDSTGLNALLHETRFGGVVGPLGTGPVPNIDANIQAVGSVWGEAWQANEKRLFATTFLRRSSQMANGPGFVYVLDYSTTPATVSAQFDLNGITPANGAPIIDLGSVCRRNATDGDPSLTCDPKGTGLSADYQLGTQGDPSVDLDAFGKVATISYGDIDMQEDADKLWLVNLNQQALISIDVSGASGTLPGAVNQYPLSAMTGWPSASCLPAVGELRPWSLKFNDGRGYIGVVCDAATSQNSADLHAYVLSFDPNTIATGLSAEIDFSLDYIREPSHAHSDFNPWKSDFTGILRNGTHNAYIHAQPILGDIEFDAVGNLYLNFIDRFGYQIGGNNHLPISGNSDTSNTNGTSGGDIIKICNVSGTWAIEGSATCPLGFRSVATVGPSGTGEYFQDLAGDNYEESVEGALALLKGSGEIVSTALDSHPGTGSSTKVTGNK